MYTLLELSDFKRIFLRFKTQFIYKVMTLKFPHNNFVSLIYFQTSMNLNDLKQNFKTNL